MIKLHSGAILCVLIFSLTLQSGMKFRESYGMDFTVQPGIRIYDTGHGWLMSVKSDGKFPCGIVNMKDSGEISWQRSFAYPLISLIPDAGGAMMLDENGNFYSIDRSGAVTANLSYLVQPGRNVMTRSNTGLVYSSGGDNSITCFKTDGNIIWMTMVQDKIMNLFAFKDGVIASVTSGRLIRYDSEGNTLWNLQLEGFAVNFPELIMNGNLLYGVRTTDGSMGKVYEITPEGDIVWETELVHGADNVMIAGDGYLIVGARYVTSLESNGSFLWKQSFEQSKKLYPMGFNDDGKLVLGILNRGDKEDSIKITLLEWGGSISVVCKVPVTKNQFMNISRRGNLVLVAEQKKTTVYRLMTMKEYIEGTG